MKTKPVLIFVLMMSGAVLFTGLGCAVASNTLKTVACAGRDDRLSITFRDPARARAHLIALRDGLKRLDPAAIRDASDLIERIARCAP